MSIRLPGLFCLLLLLGCAGFALAQAPASLEEQAEVEYLQGETRMRTSGFEDAIQQFRNIIKRYPDTQVRYKAQLRLADALLAVKKETDAFSQLQSIVKEEDADWSPKALAKIGEFYVAQAKYADAFHAYRQIIVGYPDSPMVDHAHFAIGSTHFQLGHYELAAVELDKVGTTYAARAGDQQRVAPGEPLVIRIIEPNLVAATDVKLAAIVVTGKSGDTEKVELLPEAEDSDRFAVIIPTALATGKANDGTLQLYGNDTITLTFQTRYVGDGAQPKTVSIGVAANARTVVRDSTGIEVRGIILGDQITVEVQDADRDQTDAADTVTVELKTKKKDLEKLTLTETGPHTGVFTGPMKTAFAKDGFTAENGVIECNALMAEGSGTRYDDLLTINYTDEVHLQLSAKTARIVATPMELFTSGRGEVAPVQASINNASLEMSTMLFKGRSLIQIAATYRDLGQATKARQFFRDAKDQFSGMITKYPTAPEVEDALYGLFQAAVAQEDYNSAIGTISQIIRRFPQSTRASEALYELASLYVKQENFSEALIIYQRLAQSSRGTKMAEEAQFAIATTYKAMLKPKKISMEKNNPVNREQVTFALEEFIRTYPQSERTPDAYWELVQMRNDDGDFRGAVDSARRMVATFPDHPMTGRVLLQMAQAQIYLRDRNGALDTLRTIIANYGAEAETAKPLLKKAENLPVKK